MKEATARSASAAPDLPSWLCDAPVGGPLWLQRLRKSARETFEQLGFPTVRDEEWRQTSVASIASTRFTRGSDGGGLAAADLDLLPFADLGCPRLVLVNGRFRAELSCLSPATPGVRFGSLAQALRDIPDIVQPHLGRMAPCEGRSFVALNTALFEDGALVIAKKGTTLESPLHILHVNELSSEPRAAYPRSLVLVEESARVTLIETFLTVGEGTSLSNAVSEVVVAEDASLIHARVQNESRSCYHVGRLESRVDRNGRFVSLNASLGCALARNDVGIRIEGPGAESTLNGLYVGDGNQFVDNHTTIDHAAPHGTSHELYKGVLSGAARAVFNGRIIVRPGAQKTDARQSNRNLLLSDEALVHTRPQLEIHADDVKCTHGATIGHLDEDALFYLRSRGIGWTQARKVLIHAFTGAVLPVVGCEPLCRALEGETARRLERDPKEENLA